MTRIDASQKTIPHLFAWRAALDPDSIALLVKRQKTFQQVTWRILEEDVLRAIDLLAQTGVAAGKRVAQIAENRYEWIVADLAIQSLGAVHVPLHATLTPVQQAAQGIDSDPCCILLSTLDELNSKTLTTHFHSLPMVTFAECNEPGVIQWPAALSHADAERGRVLRDAWLDQVTPDTVATILYTSGTTGEPKGVVLSQGNITSNAWATARVFADQEEEVRINILPLSHIFARTCDMYVWLARGAQLALAESRETIVDDCQSVQPHLLNGVPYFFERTIRTLHGLGIADQPGILQKAFGGRLRMCCSGGAPLPDAVFDYFAGQGIPLLQGYGLTETSPVITVNAPNASRRGSVGLPLADVEVRIESDGEISARGPNVMQGYWRKPAASAEVLQDGWFATGDIGHVDNDGYLWITGRKKEILVTAAGKKIAPALVESLLNQDPLIAQSIVLGDDRKYLIALIVPDTDQLQARLEANGLPVDAWTGPVLNGAVQGWYEQAIRTRLENLSRYEQVQKFCLLTQGFTIETGELTPKMSLRRAIITSHHRDRIEALYAS
ncbi:MAG: AMP-dependent synthetase/ligase, partial [Planctomycetota bacterium]|nr:AMP-dependent synthetase/ligase [Planctomycetota bacterium]